MGKNVLIICETGISAALLVSKTLEEVQAQSLNLEVDYAQTSKLAKKLDQEDYDVFILTPQVFSKKDKISKILEDKDVNGSIIEMTSEEIEFMNVGSLLRRVNETE